MTGKEREVVVIPPKNGKDDNGGIKRQLRVASYSRVSTDAEEQLTSFYTQKTYYTDLIMKNPEWALVGTYADEGISGASANKRPEFMKMIKKCYRGKIDLIITKSISRFARNTLDSIGYVRKLKAKGIGVFFEKENINTLEESSEVVLTILSSLAQEELNSMSMNIKMGRRMAMQEGRFNYNFAKLFGYTVDEEGIPVIVLNEGKVVKRIFSSYLAGDSMGKIADNLMQDGIPAPSGKLSWKRERIRAILNNVNYIGDIINFKTTSKSYKLKDRLKNAEENWERHYGVHEAIIDINTWNIVQKTMESKMRSPKKAPKNIFAGFLKCSDCGANLNYKFTHDNPVNHYFSCFNKRNNNGLCKTTHHIRVDALTHIVSTEIKRMMRYAKKFEDEFVKMLKDDAYEKTLKENQLNLNKYNKLQLREAELDKIIQSLFESKVLGSISNERFIKMSASYENEISENKKEMRRLNTLIEADGEKLADINKFITIVKETIEFEELTLSILQRFIDKIIVHHAEKINGEKNQKIEIYYKFIGKFDFMEVKTEMENAKVEIELENGQKKSANSVA